MYFEGVLPFHYLIYVFHDRRGFKNLMFPSGFPSIGGFVFVFLDVGPFFFSLYSLFFLGALIYL